MINPILARFQNEPALIAHHSAELFEANLNEVAKVQDKLDAMEVAATGEFWTELGDAGTRWLRPYNVQNGVLLLPVKGSLLKNFPYQFGAYATGYEYIEKALQRGLADTDVKGIALVIDSPGGMVAGNFELVDKIHASRGQKPIKAFASDSAYSAAYSIASAADDITVTRSGGVGSIGVVTMHIDASAAMDKMGYKITFIYAGKHKVDGNPYEALPAAVRERIQERIDALYDVFVATVARNRSMDEKAVRKTEALTFTASDAISNKLADSIGSLDDGLAAFAANINREKGETNMTTKTEEAAVDQTKIDAAKAEGKKDGMAEGAKAERARISGILALDESKDRHAAALNIGLNTQLSIDEAKGLLATLPQDKAPAAAATTEAAKNPFDSAMKTTGNPEVGSGEGETEAKSDVDTILADYEGAGGRKAQKAS